MSSDNVNEPDTRKSDEGAAEATPEMEAQAEDAASNVNAEGRSSEAEEELARYKEQVLRLQAEMENVRRRAEMDVEKAHKFALEKFARELLPVVDSLEKAIEAAQGDDEVLVNMRQGIELTLNMLLSALKKFNIEQIDPVGEPFDPQLHEAMSLVEAPDMEPNSVMAVMQKGYTLNDRLVRPAMVMVSKSEAGTNVNEKA